MNLKKLILLFFIITIIGCESEKFTTANGKTLEVSSLVGMNVFDIAYEYSKVTPTTLTGTNNERWVVYYKDIDFTLETKKTTNIVQKATKGRRPKSRVWAK